MAKRTKWKIAGAILTVVIAGIVYCAFFTEEKDGMVQYQTEEEFKEEVGSLPEVNVGNEMSSEQAEDVQSDESKLIYVHVCGAVRNPAVYSLPEGARVYDVIAKAGGLNEDAADDYVNQARFLTDGERVYIPQRDELKELSVSQYAAGQDTAGRDSGAHTEIGGGNRYPVNINTAGVSELITLPGIGESRAESIIAYREQYGSFSKIEDIMKISGIKGAAYEKIKDKICTENE